MNSTERTVTLQGGLNVAEEVRGRRIWLDRKVRLPIHGTISTAFQFHFTSIIIIKIKIKIKIQFFFSRSLAFFLMGFVSFGPLMGFFVY
jgi:hypothetical protein